MPSPAEILDVAPEADEEALETAYRRRIKEAHPDQGGSVEEFQRVRSAYEQLLAGEGSEMAADPEAAEQRWERTATTQVTYLDYDVLTDRGWDVDDADLFATAAAADLAPDAYGEFEVLPEDSLLEGAERAGHAWPFACRGGACVNCAIILHDGELSMPPSHVLPAEMHDRGVRLSCNGMPITDELQVIFNVKHMPDLEELLLPPRPFKQAYAGD
jgi:ferredoxin